MRGTRVPPYLAYYGVMKGDDGFVQQACESIGPYYIYSSLRHRSLDLQVSLYRKYLSEPNSTHGLLRHIQMGDQRTQDAGLWSTGNAWAAWGMVRVLATMLNAGMGWDYRCEDLRNWAVTILQSAFVDLNVRSSPACRKYKSDVVVSHKVHNGVVAELSAQQQHCLDIPGRCIDSLVCSNLVPTGIDAPRLLHSEPSRRCEKSGIRLRQYNYGLGVASRGSHELVCARRSKCRRTILRCNFGSVLS